MTSRNIAPDLSLRPPRSARKRLLNPEYKEWLVAECEKLGIDPVKSTLFDCLDADDRAMFP